MSRGICKFLIFICIVFLFLSLPLLAREDNDKRNIIFQIDDPVGDDWGPGSYTYPRYKHFEPFKGLFDLTRFSIIDADPDYILEFAFTEIRDPWRSKYGFSHPLIQIYFDNQPGGSTELFRPGARVKLDSNAPWDVMLNITGWWVRLFRPTDRERVKSMKIPWNDTKNPFELSEAVVTLEENVIKVQLPKTIIGDLSKAKFFLLIGAFFPFGEDHYREVKKVSDDWAFGGSTNPELSPRVLDILVPDGMVQEEVLKLSQNARDFVTIPYIAISRGTESMIFNEKILIWVVTLIVIVLLALVIKIKSKKDPVRK
ncbi:glucodextranase DOMON-like domain-containing protein [Anoxybacter fermentans]|uniref:glucodextranase DOMON-like domain-containing protein n=1 Tax=Anoxybacter fermentans TaxID=1323375 RepID=UPI0013DEE1E9|nr:glucodextranase DOMON-like domain-containing protein [Anoxybacter fermentans]